MKEVGVMEWLTELHYIEHNSFLTTNYIYNLKGKSYSQVITTQIKKSNLKISTS